MSVCSFFFFNDTATTEIYTLSLHDALPISWWLRRVVKAPYANLVNIILGRLAVPELLLEECTADRISSARSEEHTSELQSHSDLVCRLLLEKKKKKPTHSIVTAIDCTARDY